MRMNKKNNIVKCLMQNILSALDVIWHKYNNVSRHRLLIVILVGALAFSGSVFIGMTKGIPVPVIDDEFSYLLAADTFSRGRLTNPTHPMWVHFENVHILQKPTYMSKYPPAQGAVLAFGKLFGHPIFGVWLSMALMCAAICWMLQAWVPLPWVFIGGLLVILNPDIGINSYWAQSYWGGAVAAFAGALFFGSLRRMVKKVRLRYSLLIALGIVILFYSRPFEGLIAILPAFVFLFFWTAKKIKQLRFKFLANTVIFPILLVLSVSVLAMGYYNKRITGNIFVMPYQLYELTYSSAPNFIWEKERPEQVYHNKELLIRDRNWDMKNYLKYKGVKNCLTQIKYRIKMIIFLAKDFYIPLIVSLFLGILGNFWTSFVLLSTVIFLALQSLCVWFYLHYLAPIAGLYYILIMQGFRVLGLLKLRRVYIGRLAVGLLLICIIPNMIFKTLIVPTKEKDYFRSSQRTMIIKPLEKDKKHLIIVRYGPNCSNVSKWVYNTADIDNAMVVWARELDQDPNRKLLKYFKDRRVWLLDVVNDISMPRLLPYPVEMDSKGGRG